MSSVLETKQGRPPVTNHAAIERAAFQLFEMRGFDTTTLDDIALHMGIGRRTVYRYFPSKFDIPWGQFDQNLETFRGRLSLSPVTVPLWKGIQGAVIDFNSFDENVLDQHRQRMRLIFETPSLQAHSFLMYQRWRGVIAEFVAQRTGESCDAAMPVTVGHASLGLALSAYDIWLSTEKLTLSDALDSSLSNLRQHLEH